MYSASQKRLMATEIARAGGNLSAAAERLREGYETFGSLGASTLRRYAKQKSFKAMVKEQEAIVAEAQKAAAAEAEKDRARLDLRENVLERLAHEDRILLDCRANIEAALKDMDPKTAVALYRDLTKLSDLRRKDVLPAIGTSDESTALIYAVGEVLPDFLTPTKVAECMERIRERYKARIAK